MDLRQLRGLEIARQNQVQKTKDGWYVKSQSGTGSWHVTEDFNCNCPDCLKNKMTCKHQFAVRYYLKTEVVTPHGVVTTEKRVSYSQDWAAYRLAQTKEVKLFDELLSDLVAEIDEPAQEMGRPRISLKQGLFCSIQKVYSQLSSRRAYSLYKNAEQREQIEKAPSYNAINVFLNREDITPILRELVTVSASPLSPIETKFAVDSTGFRTTGFTQYADEKYGLGREHSWLKCHAICGVKTNVITRVVVTDKDGADSPQLPFLVEKTADGGFEINELSADKAYGSAENYNAVQDVGGALYVPFKSSATGTTHGSKYRLFRKMFFFYQLHSDEFFQKYHLRSNVESTFSAVKRKFGDGLKSKKFTAQENELLCKIIAYNLTVLIQSTFELGVEIDFAQKGGVLLKK